MTNSNSNKIPATASVDIRRKLFHVLCHRSDLTSIRLLLVSFSGEATPKDDRPNIKTKLDDKRDHNRLKKIEMNRNLHKHS